MNAKQAIDIINRRAATMQKLLGAHSDEFELFSTDMTNYDIYTNSKGQMQIRNNAENRKNYRQLTSWAKRIQKTPVQVIQRQAAKKQQEYQEYYENASENEKDILDFDTYNKWLSDFTDYFESCYALVKLATSYSGKDAYEYADELYNDRDKYIDQWNYLYKKGDFDEYKRTYEEQQFKQAYDIDPISGEPIDKNDYRSL